MKIQGIRNDIDSLRKDRIKYDEQRFLTLAFDELSNTAGDFLADIKRQRSEWVKNLSVFNTSKFISDMINLYTNYKYNDEWDNQGADYKKVMVDLATALKQELAKNKKRPVKPTISATKTPATETGNSTGPPAWKFKNVRKTTTCPDTGSNYEWCKINDRKHEKGVQNGIYMPHPHNHKD